MSKLFAVLRYSLYTIGSGTLLYAFLPSYSPDIPTKDPQRNDQQRLLVLEHMKRVAETNQPKSNKPLEISVTSPETMIQIPDGILKRKGQRDEDMHKKHDNEPSQAEVFRETFKEKQLEIENLLASVEQITDRLELADIFDQISKSIVLLNRYLASSSIFLIAYDIKIFKAAIQTMQDRCAELESKCLPRKRFTFKTRRDLKTSGDKKMDLGRSAVIEKPLNNPNAYAVCGESDTTFMVAHKDITNKDVTLSNLTNCVVFIHGSPNTLHLIALESCKVVCGPVVTSVLVEKSVKSAFAFPCQQLRVHNTSSSDFHVHVTTRAIIEDTTGVRFAPYGYSYIGMDDHYLEAGLDRSRNNWDDVDDFNWLVNNKQSPNWTTIPTNERELFFEELKSYLNPYYKQLDT